jgi:hypothetical protein
MEIGAVPKILLCQRYGIPFDWAMDAFIHMCTQEQALSVEEGERLGATIAVLIGHAREILREESTVALINRSGLRIRSTLAAAAIIVQTIIIARGYVLDDHNVSAF